LKEERKIRATRDAWPRTVSSSWRRALLENQVAGFNKIEFGSVTILTIELRWLATIHSSRK
jgi:hypothetical protein